MESDTTSTICLESGVLSTHPTGQIQHMAFCQLAHGTAHEANNLTEGEWCHHSSATKFADPWRVLALCPVYLPHQVYRTLEDPILIHGAELGGTKPQCALS